MCVKYTPPYSPATDAQSDELLGARIDGRRIDERSGHPDGSVFHPFPHQLSHLLKLLRLWGDILFPEHYAPHLREPNVVHHVDGDAVVLKDGEVLRVPPPAHGVAVNDGRGELSIGALRRGRSSLSGEVGGNALAQLALGARRIRDEHQAGLAHHIDEAGCQEAVTGIDTKMGRAPGEAAHGDDAIPAHTHVGAEPRVPGAVQDTRIDDEHVEDRIVRIPPNPFLFAGARRGAEKCDEKQGGKMARTRSSTNASGPGRDGASEPSAPGSGADAMAFLHPMPPARLRDPDIVGNLGVGRQTSTVPRRHSPADMTCGIFN